MTEGTLPHHVAQALDQADRQQLELAGIGCFAQVTKIPNTGHHPRILRYYGEYNAGNGLPNGLVFQYHGGGTLAENIATSKYPEQRAWPLQAAEALQFIHSKSVIHSDFGSHNILIQDDGNLVLADFGGSKLDDTVPIVSYSSRYARPGCEEDSIEVDDIFALGTILYEIQAGHPMYQDQPSREIEKLLRQKKFPGLGTVDSQLRSVIEKCWSGGYRSADEVIIDLQRTPSRPYTQILSLSGLVLAAGTAIYMMARRRKL
ncbi:kinase-like protein [Aspergillus crustosus]